jgi:hypothetical protein
MRKPSRPRPKTLSPPFHETRLTFHPGPYGQLLAIDVDLERAEPNRFRGFD